MANQTEINPLTDTSITKVTTNMPNHIAHIHSSIYIFFFPLNRFLNIFPGKFYLYNKTRHNDEKHGRNHDRKLNGEYKGNYDGECEEKRRGKQNRTENRNLYHYRRGRAYGGRHSREAGGFCDCGGRRIRALQAAWRGAGSDPGRFRFPG